MRWNLRALDQVTETVQPASNRARGPVLAVTAVGRLPYQKCMTSPHAFELPGNIGVAVKQADVTALRNLKPGESHRIRGQWSGPCKTRLPEQSACRFALDVHVDIRRWKPGTRY